MDAGYEVFGKREPIAELPAPELVENRRRSIATLPTVAPALNRAEALELLGQLKAALAEETEDAGRGAMTLTHPTVQQCHQSTGRGVATAL